MVSERRLLERIDRLESIEAIRQLAADYAIRIDAKDLEGVAELYVDDVAVGPETGREAKVRALVRNHGGPGRFGVTIHLVMGHSIAVDADDADHATGVVSCRAEHEIGDRWVIATIQYWDDYVRRGGRWRFRTRDIKAFYVVDVLERPTPRRVTQQLTHFGVLDEAELPAAWPTWGPFWERQGRDPGQPAAAPGS
jgi:ketosteroid isomerase-like protein